MQNKDDKVGNKLPPIKKEKKRAREKDQNRFAKKMSKFWLLRMREYKKAV